MVVDVFTFNGEYDILEIRLSILDKFVDQFLIVEATETFSGLPKPLYYEKEKERYKKWHDKIKYFVVEPPYRKELLALAYGSPNTEYGKGAKHWITEFCQKESVKEALTHLKDEDFCLIGDVDEIWRGPLPSHLTPNPDIYVPVLLNLKVYCYYLNNLSSENFNGILFCPYKKIRENCLNDLRTHSHKNTEWEGWHFTSMGGTDELKRKLTNSYTNETYAREDIVGNIDFVYGNLDFLGRNFTYKLDESDWPQYLKDNREKYAHLLK